ncbi:MAG TPA: hypothetical protein VFL29_01985 [Candidatus Dormibacteraeota bacterium]|nr:hypothetical protein [Candidatus Dormibacteraeota bacterium]
MGLALGAAVVLGGLVSLSAFLVARYGPSGDGWSFRGNGALAAYALLPALLAGGWTAVVLHHRRRPWFGLASAAAAVGIALAILDAALLPGFGTGADQTVGPVILLALAAWCAIAPALAMRLPRGSQAVPASIASSIGTALLWPAGLMGGVFVVGYMFPAGS